MKFDIDVLEVSERVFFRLPPRVQEMIRVYGEPMPAPAGTLRFRMATYRVDEIVDALDTAKR